MTPSGRVFFACGLLFWIWLNVAHGGESKTAWETEWQAVNEAARKEGQLAISHTRGSFENLFAQFSQRHPAIKIVSVSGRGGDLINRIMAERRAGKYLTDLYLGSSGTPLDGTLSSQGSRVYREFYDPARRQEPAKWFRKQHHYADPEGRYILSSKAWSDPT